MRPVFKAEDWEAYRRSIACSPKPSAIEAPPDSSVFLNDYHLALVAKYLRERRPLLRTALFWHIPVAGRRSAADLSVAQGDPRGPAAATICSRFSCRAISAIS